MLERILRIEGMTCDHCAVQVREALEALPGVRATVDFPRAEARVQAPEGLPLSALTGAVAARGFQARPTGDDPGAGGGAPRTVAIVGSGSAAMACATVLAEAGVEVTVVERGLVGGTCVNIGCVPSKILIQAAKLVHRQRRPAIPGVVPGPGAVDWPTLRAAVVERVAELRHAKYEAIIEGEPRIRLLRGEARFLDPHTLAVRTEAGETRLAADRFLIATGARPAIPDLPGLADTPYWTSTEALFAEAPPESLLVLGGGVVACELAQAHARLGARVTVVSRSPLLRAAGEAVGTALETVFREEGIEVVRGEPEAVSHGDGGFRLCLRDGRELTARHLLVATGRYPNTDVLDLAAAGIDTDAGGAIPVDAHLRTRQGHIYAAGDCTDLPQFVYVAARAGTVAARHMLGEAEAALDLSVLPQVVFTDPQVALVGLSEGAARDEGRAVITRTLSLEHVPRALADFDTRGFMELVADTDGGRLLGARLLSPRAGEVVQTVALALRAGMTVVDLADTLFPYLTEVEGLKLAAQTFSKDVSRLSCCAG